MRFTPALAVRNLIAKLHPPLSQTPRESQQLLSVLQNSFNKRLDDAYPSPQSSSNMRNHGPAEQFPDVGNLSANAANAHLQAILRHPSLDHTVMSSTTSPTNLAALFDSATVAQSVNFEFIRRCVEMARLDMAPSDRAEAASSMGSRIATYFTASTPETQQAFLADRSLMSNVLPLMYMGNLEGTVWDWLRILYESSAQQQQPSDLLAEDRFIAFMTRESIKRNKLAAAVLEYSEACEYRTSRALANPKDSGQAREPLVITGNLISSAVLLRRHRHNITATLYDRLLSHAHPDPTDARTVMWPFLPLYHPDSAQSRPLYQVLKNAKYTQALLAKIGGLQRDRAVKILISILDGAELMLSQGPAEKAQFMLDFAQQHFSQMLPEKKLAQVGDLIRRARRYVAIHKHDTEGLAIT